MKRIKQLLTAACLLLAFSASAAQQSELFTLYTQYTPGALPASGVSFSDDFNRADAATLGANWTVLAGGFSNLNNQAHTDLSATNYAKNAAVWATETTTIEQYGKLTIDGSEAGGYGIYPTLLFRVNGTNEAYGVQIKPVEDQIVWMYYTNAAGNSTTMFTNSATVATNDTYGVTVSGTGTDTVVRVWLNPTGLALSATDWDGDTTPTATFTNDPPVEANSGLGIGIGARMFRVPDLKLDDFFGGDIP